ncbi:MAG: chorismate--pyruvate lyase family protein [Candidatus Azotimanducaceae bacterium]
MKAWFTQDELTHQLSDRDILSWLLEEGSITKRISSKAAFRLQILFDSLGLADEDEYTFLDLDESPIRIREVSLYGDEEPLVFARSVIPELTSRKGSPSLGHYWIKPSWRPAFSERRFYPN